MMNTLNYKQPRLRGCSVMCSKNWSKISSVVVRAGAVVIVEDVSLDAVVTVEVVSPDAVATVEVVSLDAVVTVEDDSL